MHDQDIPLSHPTNLCPTVSIPTRSFTLLTTRLGCRGYLTFISPSLFTSSTLHLQFATQAAQMAPWDFYILQTALDHYRVSLDISGLPRLSANIWRSRKQEEEETQEGHRGLQYLCSIHQSGSMAHKSGGCYGVLAGSPTQAGLEPLRHSSGLCAVKELATCSAS